MDSVGIRQGRRHSTIKETKKERRGERDEKLVIVRLPEHLVRGIVTGTLVTILRSYDNYSYIQYSPKTIYAP